MGPGSGSADPGGHEPSDWDYLDELCVACGLMNYACRCGHDDSSDKAENKETAE